MRSLIIRGEKKAIPPYPHYKSYTYRCNRFFQANNLLTLFLINGIRRSLRRYWLQWRYKFAIPLNLLIDPTSDCNLKCTGCWSADYDKRRSLSFEKLEEIITDAEKLGISEIVFSGGEPMLRREDILTLCGRHRKLMFAMFTNGTLITEEFAARMAELGNLNVFISIEGFRDKTDFRRGRGTFDKVVRAMDILREHDIGFGFSVCYHANNWEEASGEEFLDFLREKGAWLGWMFNYMPVGSGADTSLCLGAAERKAVKSRIEAYYEKHRFTIIDFANLGHKAFGCVAAGNEFAHINSNGDLEPCAFFHYSDVNIHEKRLADALASPFFRHFRKAKPFAENPHLPCPIMDVPEKLHDLSRHNGARSTHIGNPESMEQLAAKTMQVSGKWKPEAERLYREMPAKEVRKIGRFRRFLIYRD